MIKECPVIENNDAVTVVRFADKEIQFSSIAKNAKTVNVKYDNGKYSLVDHKEETEPVVNENIEIGKQIKTEVKKTKKTIIKKP